jgi:hypothetical protein
MSEFFTFIAFLAVVVALFLLFRQIVLWYWKINSSIELLTEIRDLLRSQGSSHAGHAPPAPTTSKIATVAPRAGLATSSADDRKAHQFVPVDLKLRAAVEALRDAGYGVELQGERWSVSKGSLTVYLDNAELCAESGRLLSTRE